MKEVIPTDASSRSAAFSAAAFSSGVGFGIFASISSFAVSRSVPEGSPVFGSRSMTPFGGSGICASMPARASAFEFAHPECPSEPRR
jgi:hypothetical protein